MSAVHERFSGGRRFWAVWAVLAVAAAVQAAFAARYDYYAVDLRLAREWQANVPTPLEPLLDALNAFDGRVRILIATGILGYTLVRRTRGRLAALYLAVPLSAGLVEQGVKLIVDRPRPSERLIRVTEFPDTSSFPSGHVTNATIFFGYVFVAAPELFPQRWAHRTVRVVCAVVIAFMGLARVYSGAHWPSDALGGYTLGAAILLPVVWTFRRLQGSGRFL